MLCRIADQPEKAAPIRWQQVNRPSQAGVPVQTSIAPANVTELERKIAELQSSTQAELHQVKHAAFQDGLRQGRDEASAASREQAEKLAATLAELARFKGKLRADAERELVKLSIAIARRILNRELAMDPDALEGLAHAALSKLQSRDVLQVRVFAQGLETIRSYLERAGLARSIKLVADPNLHPGDVLIDTVFGELDASVDTQLNEIERGFADRLGR
jgi:flagellar assembly protein FliH